MWIGYNTNGFAHHRLTDAIEVLAELGYEGVAITLDYHALNPFDPDLDSQTDAVKSLLRELRLQCVIETGSRFLLNRSRKHWPTLVSPEPGLRAARLDFLRRAVEIAARLESECVSFWSGAAEDSSNEGVQFSRLAEGCQALADFAAPRGVRLAFEPEPGMVVDTMNRFAKLVEQVNRSNFGLTVDVGHLHCLSEPVASSLTRFPEKLWNVHIEDMRRGIHDHLMFGQGEMDFHEVFRGLRGAGYCGGVCVELSRHSHDAVETARRSLAFLRSLQ